MYHTDSEDLSESSFELRRDMNAIACGNDHGSLVKSPYACFELKLSKVVNVGVPFGKVLENWPIEVALPTSTCIVETLNYPVYTLRYPGVCIIA